MGRRAREGVIRLRSSPWTYDLGECGVDADNATRTLKKGMRVFVAGKLVQRNWQDNDGNKRQTASTLPARPAALGT